MGVTVGSVSEKMMTLGEANWAALTIMASCGSVQDATRKNYKLYRRRVRANRRRAGWPLSLSASLFSGGSFQDWRQPRDFAPH